MVELDFLGTHFATPSSCRSSVTTEQLRLRLKDRPRLPRRNAGRPVHRIGEIGELGFQLVGCVLLSVFLLINPKRVPSKMTDPFLGDPPK